MPSTPTPFQFPDGYPELWEQLGHVIGHKLLDWGVAHTQAQAWSLELLDAMRAECGGGQLYLSKGQSYELSKRDLEIYGKFKGDNYDQLGRAYRLTSIQIRNIVKRGRARDVARKQARLF